MNALQRAGGLVVNGRAARDPLWDNLRFMAILLVVVGHSIEAASSYHLAASVYVFIYSFHMPLFAFISGYFARAEPLTVRDGIKVVEQLLAPYVIFSVIWALLRWWQEGSLELDLGSPYWHLWFLPALAIWRLSLVVFAGLRWPVAIAAVVGCVSGYFASIGWQFDASRVLGMLIFFVAGWAFRERNRDGSALCFLRRSGVRWGAIGILLVTFVGSILLPDLIERYKLRQWFQLEHNYADSGYPDWWSGIFRLVTSLCSLVLVFACIALITARQTRASKWGRSTMYVYMLHLIPIYLLQQQTDLFKNIDSPLRLASLVGAAVVLCIALSTAPVRWLCRPLVEPPLGWLIRRQDPHGAARRKRVD